MSSRTIQLHQTLHGYQDGHRLLQTSYPQSSDVERLMLIMSDMSGSSMVRGFETYITGYPLKEINAYALARTWYAPEMERPGCVWTHTLIIQNADLAHIPNLYVFLDFFARPISSSRPWETYSQPLNLSEGNITRPTILTDLKLSPTITIRAERVIHALYASPQKQVFLSVERTSDEYEQLTLALWSQQWARLRRAFKFCTGSITNRKLPEGEFDWQIVPRSSEREIKRIVKSAVFVNFEEGQFEEFPTWVKVAARDLIAQHPTRMRNFISTYGVETPKDRSVYAKLVQVYNIYDGVSRGEYPLKPLIAAVADLFPTPSSGTRLKTALFGPIDKATTKLNLNVSEAEVLESMTMSEYQAVFDAESLLFVSRAASLAKNDLPVASRIASSLLNQDLSPLGEKYIEGFCTGLLSAGVVELPPSLVNRFHILLKQNPMLATLLILWKQDDHEQRRLFDYIIEHVTLTREELSQIIIAMLEAGSDAAVRNFPVIYQDLAIETVLEWCDTKNFDEVINLGLNWRQLITKEPDICIKWLNRGETRSEPVMILISSLLSPHTASVIKGGTGLWIDFAKHINRKKGDEILTTSLCFLLALGFNNPDSEAVKLVVQAFGPVHTIAEENRLNEANWDLLKYQAPTIYWGGGWDKCGRLRNAIIEHFIKYQWPQEDFLRCLKKPKLLNKVVDQVQGEMRWGNKRYRYFQKLAKRVYFGELTATKAQERILAANFTV